MEYSVEANIPVFRPTMLQFSDFKSCLEDIEKFDIVHQVGAVKVIPPSEWNPRDDLSYKDIEQYLPSIHPKPVYQSINKRGLTYRFTNFGAKTAPKDWSLDKFIKKTNEKKYKAPKIENIESLEKIYWKKIANLPCPIYQADVDASLFDKTMPIWNLRNLTEDTHFFRTGVDGLNISGITSPYLYFGMWRTTFPWHVEDMDLYSINYHHFGAPKTWYIIPPSEANDFKTYVKTLDPKNFNNCKAFLRHKTVIIRPDQLRSAGITVNRITQTPRDFVITLPRAYHHGYNNGYNCAEAVNFATPRWIEIGRQASKCSCEDELVSFDIDAFLEKAHPQTYENEISSIEADNAGNDDFSRVQSEQQEQRKQFLIRRLHRLPEDVTYAELRAKTEELFERDCYPHILRLIAEELNLYPLKGKKIFNYIRNKYPQYCKVGNNEICKKILSGQALETKINRYVYPALLNGEKTYGLSEEHIMFFKKNLTKRDSRRADAENLDDRVENGEIDDAFLV